jgi:HlyD family secretion protein
MAALTIAAVALSATGCSGRNAAKATFRTEAAKAGRIVTEVAISGVLVPGATVSVYPKISGLVKELPVDAGDRVTAGELVARIDVKELAAQLEVAEASTATVRDQAAQAKVGIETARLNLDLAQKNFDRSKALFDTKVVTQAQIDDAQGRLDLAKSAYDNAQRQYQTVGVSSLGQAAAQANLIRVQISNSEIASPISGRVTNRNINLGELCSPSAALMTIADTDNLKLQGNLSQADLFLVKEGDAVKVSIDGLPEAAYGGKISQIGPVAAATGQYFPVSIKLRNDGKLFAGMTAKASLTVTSREGVVVPLAAVVQRGADTVAYVVSDGRASERKLSLGARSAVEVQVLSGVKAGESVATSGAAALQDGAEVPR